jgi:hypothetical protein
MPSAGTLLSARKRELARRGLTLLTSDEPNLELWDGAPEHVEILLLPQWHTSHPHATLSYDAKGLKSSLSVKKMVDGTFTVRGAMYDLRLSRDEGRALFGEHFGEPSAVHLLHEALRGDAAHAFHLFLLNSADPLQESVIVMILLSSSGNIAGVSGFSQAEAELKQSILKVLPHLKQPLVSVCDGDRGNSHRPRAIANRVVKTIQEGTLAAFGEQRLHELAKQLPANWRCGPDGLHCCKNQVNRAMPDDTLLNLFPTDEFVVHIRQLLLDIGAPPAMLNTTRKLHDQNALWFAFSNSPRLAVERGKPEALPFLITIILHLRSLLDVAPREQLLAWLTVDWGIGALQLVARKLQEARALGWTEAKRQGNHGLLLQSSETYEKIIAGSGELAIAVANRRAKYTGIFSTQNCEHALGALAGETHGDLSVVNIANAVGRSVGRRVLTHRLGLDAAKPGRLSERHSGAILPAVSRIDFSQVLTIAQGIEAAFEIFEFATPDRFLEWPEELLGPRPGRVFADVQELLAWLPQPKPKISKRVMSTEQVGLTTAATFGHVLLAKQRVDMFQEATRGQDVDDGEVEEDEPENQAEEPVGDEESSGGEDADESAPMSAPMSAEVSGPISAVASDDEGSTDEGEGDEHSSDDENSGE